MMENQKFYNNLYSGYETKTNIKFYETSSNEIIRLIEKYNENKMENILDLCCGTGLLTRRLRQAYAQTQILGMDISEKMINIAKEKNIEDVEFILQDANKVGEINKKFDVITSNYGIQWLNRDVFKGINSILKKDGLLVCSIPGYILGTINVNKESSEFVGNRLFKIIVDMSKKYEKLEGINYGKKIVSMWNNTMEYTKLKEGANENGLKLIYEGVKSCQLDYSSSRDLVESTLNRGTFGDVFIHSSSEFMEELVKCIDKYEARYKNLKEENITQFLIFKKVSD